MKTDYGNHKLELQLQTVGEFPRIQSATLVPRSNSIFGFGGLVRFRDQQHDNQVGIRAPVGLSYMFDRLPVDIFVKVAPAIDVALVYETPPGRPVVQLISQTSEKFTGTLTAIDTDERTVKARSLFAEKKFNLGENCVIVANGRPDGQLSDPKPDDKLIFTYDEINGVNVVNHIDPAKENKNTVAAARPEPGY